MFDDRDLLRWTDKDLREAADRQGIALPEWPEKPKEPIVPPRPDPKAYADEEDYLAAMEYFQAAKVAQELAHTLTVKDYRAAVTLVSNQRKDAVEQIMKLENPHPSSWRELVERLFANEWLDRFVRSQLVCRAARDEATREGIVQGVKVRLYFVIVSNAGKWRATGDHTTSWRGYIIRQVPKLAQKCAADLNPRVWEFPRGDFGPDGFDPVALLEQQRELDPKMLAELSEEWNRFQELMEADLLSDEERRLLQLIVDDPLRGNSELADELGISKDKLGRRKNALIKKVLRALGWIP